MPANGSKVTTGIRFDDKKMEPMDRVRPGRFYFSNPGAKNR
jgi:hypothetical protein